MNYQCYKMFLQFVMLWSIGYDLKIDKKENKLIVPPLNKDPLIPSEDLVKKKESFIFNNGANDS